MPYSGSYYPAFGRTQSALGDVSNVIQGLGQNIALQKEREQSHELAMRGLEIQRAGAEAKQELGLLKTQADIKKELELREQREYLRTKAEEKERRDIKTQGLRNELLSKQIEEARYQEQPISMRNEFLINAGIPEPEVDAFINQQGIYTQAALKSVGRRDVQRKLFNDIATAYRKEKADLIKADTAGKRKKEYEYNRNKIIGLEQKLANIKIIKQDPNSLLSQELLKTMDMLSGGGKDFAAFEQSLIQDRDYYLGLTEPYEAEKVVGELTKEFNPAEYKGKAKVDSETNQWYISDGESWNLYTR